MAGKRRVLSPAQVAALNNVREVGRRYKILKSETEIRVREQVRQENAKSEAEYASVIRRAKEVGIPISTIGSEGMGTSDRNTVNRWLEKTAHTVSAPMDASLPSGVFAWQDAVAGIVAVRFADFPTSVNADDYPVVLEGVAQRDSRSSTGWRVLSDPGTVQTELGPLKGWFSVEIEDVALDMPGSLTSLLNEWAGA